MELGLAPVGLFGALILDQLVAPPPQEPVAVAPGPNLRMVTFKPLPWRQRVLWPSLKKSGMVAGVLGLVAVSSYSALSTYRSHRRQQALSQLALAQAEKGKGLAFQEAQSALELAESSQDAQVIARVHALLGRLAQDRSDEKAAVAEYRLALSGLPDGTEPRSQVQTALGKILRTQARVQWKAALGYAGRHQFAEALQATSRALQLFQEGQGSARERADCHYLTGSLYEQMNLPDESRQSLTEALRLDPSHSKARRLLAHLPAPRPKDATVARVSPPVRRYNVSTPMIYPGSPQSYRPYPTYQPPVSQSPAFQSPTYPTYQPPPIYRPSYQQPTYPSSSRPPRYQKPSYQSPSYSAPAYPTARTPTYPSAYKPPPPVQPYPTYQPAYRPPTSSYPTGGRR